MDTLETSTRIAQVRSGGARSNQGRDRLGVWALRGMGLERREDWGRGRGLGIQVFAPGEQPLTASLPPVGGCSSQVPLLRDADSSVTSGKNQVLLSWTCL